MTALGERENYWRRGDLRLRAAGPADAAMFYEHFRTSPAETERAFEKIGFPVGLDAAERWLRGYGAGEGGAAGASDAGGADDRCVFVVERADDGAFLGYVDVWETDRRSGVFKTGIKMLEGHAGKGYATRAFTLVLGFYFDELRYQKCGVYIYDFNAASHRFHKKLGFVEEGRLRREYYSQGRYFDSVCYGLFAEDFRARRDGLA
ncbi:MAG: GNAT family N-acetyltransferase [Clostridiales bacterium]|jgi:RimJ/RimL family protein N-acetyltransferase|nr:GNAT family N-acetyltransferase [Clostridiales bacterium]